jgi:hypothetical protein
VRFFIDRETSFGHTSCLEEETMMDSQTMRGQSLEEIDGSPWGDPPADATRLVATVHRLRRVPIGRLDVEGLRVLIGHKVGLDALVPVALDRLQADPLAECDYYPGDLLAAAATTFRTTLARKPQHAG